MKLIGEMASRLSAEVEDSEVPVLRIGRARAAEAVPAQRRREPTLDVPAQRRREPTLDARDRLERTHPELFLG
jgi:hypothetical protein